MGPSIVRESDDELCLTVDAQEGIPDEGQPDPLEDAYHSCKRNARLRDINCEHHPILRYGGGERPI